MQLFDCSSESQMKVFIDTISHLSWFIALNFSEVYSRAFVVFSEVE